MTILRMTRLPDNRCGFPVNWPRVTIGVAQRAVDLHNAAEDRESSTPVVRSTAPRVASYIEGEHIVLEID